jgi:glycosyltransferase involved in cell wall biosynthesis
MPRILRIINRFNLGGPTYNVSYLSKFLSPEFDTLLVGGKYGEAEASSKFIINELGLHTLIIPEMEREINGYNDMQAYYKIKSIIKRYKPDIVHTHASKAGFLGRYAAKHCNVPIIVHTFHGHIFHSYFNKTKTTLFKSIERHLAVNTDKIIAISKTQKYELCNIHQIADESKFEVIPLGFDLLKFNSNIETKRKKFRENYRIGNDELAIVIVGRLVPVKNHELFIKAIAKIIPNTNRKIKAIIVGDGELKEKLINLSVSLGLKCSLPEKPYQNADVIFTSWIEEADYVFAGADITALTSLNEGTPVSLIESQASNTPVVSTNVGGIEDIISNNITGLLARNNDVDDFAEKLKQLVENDELRNKMSCKGWTFVKDKFHYTRLVNDMRNLYNKLLN